MPVVPPQGNKKPVVPPQGNKRKKLITVLSKAFKKNLWVYTVFFIVLLETISLFLKDLKSYQGFIYPLLSQFTMLVLTFHFVIKSKSLKFCFRKKIAFTVLSIYYFLNIIYLVFSISDNIFYNIITVLMFATIFILSLLTLKE